MIKLTNFQKRILKQNLAEIAAKNTKLYFGDLVFAFEWIDNHEEFEEKTVIFISRKNGIELNYLDNHRIQSYLGWDREGDQIGAHLPSAAWLMSADGTYKSQRGKKFRRVWCEVSYVADVDYTNEVLKLPKKCFTDRLPDGGYYEFRESGNRLWIIADRIRVDRILTEEERQQILNDMKYDEQAAFKPYKQAMARRMKIS